MIDVSTPIQLSNNDQQGPRVQVCRGCCCGTAKHPDIDHDAQLAAISAVAQTRTIECVGECANSNVVIVRPAPGELVWFGGITDDALTTELCEWLAAGAALPLPPNLEAAAFLNAAKPRTASR